VVEPVESDRFRFLPESKLARRDHIGLREALG
jgi:hypothetical protein